MRHAVIEALTASSEARDSLPWLVTGDLGWGVIEAFAEQAPERFLNAGVSEQAMIGVSAGVASETGNPVFAYSIANFASFRCLEQIRNDVCYHQLPVTIVSLGAGFAYGLLGYTHFGIEDLAAVRAIPDITIVSPASDVETHALTRQLISDHRPAYLRLARNSLEDVFAAPVELGNFGKLRDGHDIVILATGAITAEALDAADLLSSKGVSTEVWSAHTIVRPLDYGSLAEFASRRVHVIVVEEHLRYGGLFGSIAEWSIENAPSIRLQSVAIEGLQLDRAGNRAQLLERHGLSTHLIAARILANL